MSGWRIARSTSLSDGGPGLPGPTPVSAGMWEDHQREQARCPHDSIGVVIAFSSVPTNIEIVIGLILRQREINRAIGRPRGQS
eukprot:6212370-Pleurochrysis_carterae.AAC.1